MNIGEFADRAGLSAHTLRYYERIGLLRRIARNASGHRDFDATDLAWIAFVKRLKATGMPLADIRRYAELRAAGEATTAARQALLETHAALLESRLAREQEHLEHIRDKIAYYRTLIADA